MEFIAIKTSTGLRPAYDDDYEQYAKLKTGEAVKIKVSKVRNLEFHRKYFALINCAWSYQSEARINFFKNSIELFRKSVEIAAGHCELVYSVKRKEWVEIPKSISFSKMDNFAFQELYERVKDVLFATFLTHITEEEFTKNLINF